MPVPHCLPFDVEVGAPEPDADGAGDGVAEGSRGPELGEEKIILDAAAEFFGLGAGRVHEGVVDDAALFVDSQVDGGVGFTERDRGHVFHHRLGIEHGRDVADARGFVGGVGRSECRNQGAEQKHGRADTAGKGQGQRAHKVGQT